ncbi:MAG: polysaccharide deacetylase family protein [Rickettsiales bacterium]
MDAPRTAPLHLDGPLATFTFDDFPASAYDVGGKLVESFGAKATYFVSSQFHNQTVNGLTYYTTDHLRQVHAMGHEIGCHGASHVQLGEHGPAFARGSIQRNKAFMKELFGDHFEMTSFAYPYGDTSMRVKRAAAKEYPLLRGVNHGSNFGTVDLSQIRVVSLEARHWNEDHMKRVIDDAVRYNHWLVYLTHDVSADPTPYGSTEPMVRIPLELLQAAGIPIKTLRAAAESAIFVKPEATAFEPSMTVPIIG